MGHIEVNLLDVFLYPLDLEVLKKCPDAEVYVRMRADDLAAIVELAEGARRGTV